MQIEKIIDIITDESKISDELVGYYLNLMDIMTDIFDNEVK